MNVRLPKVLRDLAAEDGPTRQLYLPEIRALCRLVKAGQRHPYRGVEMRGIDLDGSEPEKGQRTAADPLHTAYFVFIEREGGTYTRIMLLSRPWSAYFRGSPRVRPENMKHTSVMFGVPKLDVSFSRLKWLGDLPAEMRPEAEGIFGGPQQ